MRRTARQLARGLARRPLVLVACCALFALAFAAVFADELASDRPILLRQKGRLYVLPNRFDPPALRNETVQTLRAGLQDGDWMIGPLLPYGPNRSSQEDFLAPPGGEHPLGTDEVGRDVLARIIHGARVSLTVGFVAVAFYVLIGVLVGALAGYYGGTIDLLLSRAVETMMTFPAMFLVLCVLGMMRVRTLYPIMVVIGLTRWMEVARLTRAEVLRLRELDFVQASRALGASDARVLWRHVVPNAMAPVLVSATFGVAGAILLESGLSFLGFGAPPPTPSWGELLTQAHVHLAYLPGGGALGAWWLALYPGLAIFLAVCAFNLVAEALRDALDPRLKG